MKTKQHLKLALGYVLAVSAISSFAQTPTPPNNVGVSESKAAAAADKAVPRSDTATLVRTPDQAAPAAPATTAAPVAATAPAAPMQPAPAPMRRAPKADRN